MIEDDYVKLGTCVSIGNGEWISTDLVEFLDISEDFEGYDLMTFSYNDQVYESRVRMQPVE